MTDAVEIQMIADEFDPDSKPVDRVMVAQSLIKAAIELLKSVAEETNDRNAEAYRESGFTNHFKFTLVNHLAILAGSDHGFLDRSMNLDKWIECLEDDDDYDELLDIPLYDYDDD